METPLVTFNLTTGWGGEGDVGLGEEEEDLQGVLQVPSS